MTLPSSLAVARRRAERLRAEWREAPFIHAREKRAAYEAAREAVRRLEVEARASQLGRLLRGGAERCACGGALEVAGDKRVCVGGRHG